MGSRAPRERAETGQMLVLFVLLLAVLLGFAALVIDVGLAFRERRSLQNAVDAAALAAAQDLFNSGSEDTAVATAIDYMQRHGFSDVEDIEVNIPPTSGSYAGQGGYVEVKGSSQAPTAFLGLFREEPYTMRARAVAVGAPGSESAQGGEDCGKLKGDEKKKCEKSKSGLPPPATVPSVACGSPTVDGRVTASDGYTSVGDLRGGTTDYGDVFYACDGTYLYFAMRLNALQASGVANENVYGKGDYNALYETGWNHSFGALLGSDRARFQVACDGVARHDFVQDYLRVDGSQWSSDPMGDGRIVLAGPAASASSLEWNLEHPYETGWGDGPGENPLVQSPPFNPKYGTYDAEYAGWVWEMIYEFKVPAAAYADCAGPVQFGLHNFSGESGPLQGIHSSPAKVKEGVTLLITTGDLRLVE